MTNTGRATVTGHTKALRWQSMGPSAFPSVRRGQPHSSPLCSRPGNSTRCENFTKRSESCSRKDGMAAVPVHYSGQSGGVLLEIYPVAEESTADRTTRLGFDV